MVMKLAYRSISIGSVARRINSTVGAYLSRNLGLARDL